MAITQCF